MNKPISLFTRAQRRNKEFIGNQMERQAQQLMQMQQTLHRVISSVNMLNNDFNALLRYNPVNEIVKGDFVAMDYVGRYLNEDGSLGDGFRGNQAEGMCIRNLGSGELVPGFEDALIGKGPGDCVEIELTFPEDYHADMANKKVKFFVSILEVLREPLGTEFVKKEVTALNEYNAAKLKKSEESLEAAKKLAESEATKSSETAESSLDSND